MLVKIENSVINQTGVFFPFKAKLAKLGIVAAQCVANCENSFIPIKLVNLSDRPVTLYKHTKLGQFEVYTGNNCEDIFLLDEIDSNPKVNVLLEQVEKNSNLCLDQKEVAKSLLKEYANIFSQNKKDIGFCKLVKHEIDIKANAPVQQIHGKVPLHVEEWVDKQVNDLKDLGIIRDSTSPWSAPVVVVKKKNGDFRMCVDYRRLNSITVKPVYKIPDSQSLFNHLSGATMFSAIDVSSAYYQCEIREEDKKLTAFTTRNGHFEFNRMPFGLSGAPFSFQRLMHAILRDENWLLCLIYLDDILIFSQSFEEHIERIRVIFDKIKQSGLKLSPDKCNFFLNEVKFLGHVVSSDGLKTDPDKIKALKEWPLPATVTEMRQFLGFANYYRKFVRSYAELTVSLETMLKNSSKKSFAKNDNTPLQWTTEGKDAFLEIKHHLCEAPCLTFPIRDCKYILDADASHCAIGCVLSQVQGGSEKVIAYGSRKLSNSEKQYCITRKELLAVYYFVTHFKQFLLGSKFVVRTDHKALKWLLNWEKPNTSQYCSWIAELEIYDFKIEHRAGDKHTNADFFSRPFEKCQQCELIHPDPKNKRNTKILYLSENDDKLHLITDLHQKLGHVGENKLLSFINENEIPNSKHLVKRVIRDCIPCSHRKVVHYTRNCKSFSSPFPFHTIALDIAGPLPYTKQGNKYLLSVIDVFSFQ